MTTCDERDRGEAVARPGHNLAEVLDGAVAQLKRFLIVPDPTYLDTIALWSAHTHLVHLEASASATRRGWGSRARAGVAARALASRPRT